MAVTYAASVPARTAGNDKYLGPYGPSGSATFISGVTENGKRVRTTLLTATGTYTTGGDAIAASLVGLRRIDEVYIVHDDAQMTNTAGGIWPAFVLTDPANPLIKHYTTPNVEVTNGTSLSTRSFLVRLVGS